MLAATFKPEMEIAGFSIIPSQFTLESYRLVFRKIPITRGFINSLFVAMVVTASVIVFGSMVGYALSRLRFRGREMIFNLALVTMIYRHRHVSRLNTMGQIRLVPPTGADCARDEEQLAVQLFRHSSVHPQS